MKKGTTRRTADAREKKADKDINEEKKGAQ